MTSLDPSHIPSHSSDRRHGQAVHDSVSAPSHTHGHAPENISDDRHEASKSSQPSWKGAWARRQAAKQQERERQSALAELDSDDDDNDAGTFRKKKSSKKDGRIPVPPIPDLRYEQGVLMSIRPFLHRASEPTPSSTATLSASEIEKDDLITVGENSHEIPSGRSPAHEARHDDRVEDEEKTAMVSAALTAEGAEQGLKPNEESDLFSGPLRIEWSQVSYIIIRDQVIYPLLQGLLWGAGGLWIASLWGWNKSRLAAKSSAPSGNGRHQRSLLSQLGLRAR